MKQRPILFNSAMVRALLDGSKTQTRRIVKPHGWTVEQMSKYEFVDVLQASESGDLTCKKPAVEAYAGFNLSHDAAYPTYFNCLFGTVGDQLWVRETWRTDDSLNDKAPSTFSSWPVQYEADGKKLAHVAFHGNTNGKTRVSIHMPRWASRITLEITSIRVERLQDISEEDAKQEGITPLYLQDGEAGCWYSADTNNKDLHARTAKQAFRKLWESTGGNWEANPWVWVIEFKRVEQ